MPLTIPSNVANCIYYQDGQFLTAQTMQTEADYFTNWITLQNQSLYNPGWLMGLEVTAGTGNTLAVDPGTGLDAQGHFLVLPGTGGVYTVPTSTQNPCFLCLGYPTQANARAGQPPQTQNMAAVLSLGSTLVPSNGITLAEISLDGQGGIIKVTDRRTPATSRIAAQTPLPMPSAGGTGTLAAEAAPPAALVPRHGSIDLPAEKLARPGDAYEANVAFVSPGVPAFSAPPRVVATIQGALSYVVSVDRIDTIGFVLRVTAITHTADPPARLVADWVAIEP